MSGKSLAIGEAVVSLAVEVSNLGLVLSSSEKPTEGYHVMENQQKLEHVTRPYVQVSFMKFCFAWKYNEFLIGLTLYLHTLLMCS